MFGIGRLLKKKVLYKFLFFALGNLFTKMQILKKFKKRLNAKKKNLKYSTNLDAINQFEYMISSQNNEDGIIDHITNKICISKFFVEIGVEFSEFNCLQLIKNGWSGIIIEANQEECQRLKLCIDYFFPNNKIIILNIFVTKDNLNEILSFHVKNKIIDFLSIDIDGIDYYVLKNLDLKNVNSICCEYNYSFGRERKLSIPYIDNFYHKGDYYFGASLSAFSDLLESKHFFLACVESAGVNAFFVKEKFNKYFKKISPLLSFREQSRMNRNLKDKIYNASKNFNLIEV